MYAALKNSLHGWLFQLRGPQAGPIVLVQRRIFILPTGQGYVFACFLVLMLAGSINYSLSLGFVLTFLLAAMGIVAMVHTFRNLLNLRISAGRAHPVFAGETACFFVCIFNPGPGDRVAVALTRDRTESTFVDIPAQRTVDAGVSLPAPRRGLMRAGRLTLYTRFPLGLYYAWSYLELNAHCLVYPRPAPPGLGLPQADASTGIGMQQARGQEDFMGLRQYHGGDSPRHIAWKAAARGQGLLTKQFSGHADALLWLDWNALPAQQDIEQRLSQLARWVLDAHGRGLAYGLRIPECTIEQGSGELHRDRCLEALALFGTEDRRNDRSARRAPAHAVA